LIAAGIGNGSSGNNENAQKLSEIMKKNFDQYESFTPTNPKPDELIGSVHSFYAGIVGKLGVKSQSAQKDLVNSTTLANSVEMNRQSVSAVSLDEELTNMIKFQQAYSSSARMLTAMDELLDKVINGMGVVGR
jgi:flagellar hook-associated protein 1 FlgK